MFLLLLVLRHCLVLWHYYTYLRHMHNIYMYWSILGLFFPHGIFAIYIANGFFLPKNLPRCIWMKRNITYLQIWNFPVKNSSTDNCNEDKKGRKKTQGKYFPVCRYIHVIVTVLNYMTLKFFIYFVKTSVILYKTFVRKIVDIFPYLPIFDC